MNILAFGVIKEILGKSEIMLNFEKSTSIADLKNKLRKLYPDVAELSNCMIAVNDEYATDLTIISDHDEIAIIPPVSGG